MLLPLHKHRNLLSLLTPRHEGCNHIMFRLQHTLGHRSCHDFCLCLLLPSLPKTPLLGANSFALKPTVVRGNASKIIGLPHASMHPHNANANISILFCFCEH
ncbi:hypothetical protein VNO78_25047 [Psophocarpus tetragonolobus]|uniref:Uncharacterized protein n=1 Tax=Psophocarpus tetragonolobus TaxID=3891 RepID=A0AAN9S8S9_PSOTE